MPSTRGDATTDAALDETLAHYRLHGFARLPPVLDEAELAALRRRTEDLMLGRDADPARFFYQHDTPTGRYEDLEIKKGWIGPSFDYRKIEKLERDETFRRVIEHPTFGRIARTVLGPEVVVYRAILMCKSAQGGTELPWHQDGGSFWGLDRDPVLQIWMALDDAPADGGCVEVIPGSHLGGLATPLGGLIPPALTEPRRAEIVALPARAGDVLVLHNLVWHRSGRSRPGHRRWAMSVCYLSGDTRCIRRKRTPRTFVKVFGASAKDPDTAGTKVT